jgi:hypothetical protein
VTDSVTIHGGTFNEAEHLYTNVRGTRVWSVTQVLAMCGMVDYRFVKKEVLEWKSSLGMAVHKGVELMVQQQLDWDTIAEAAMGFILGVDIWMKEQQFVSESQEQCGIHTLYGMQYGYRYDHRGTMLYKGKRRKAILDLKCTTSISPACALQTAGYELASPKLPSGERYLRIALQAFEDASTTPHYYEDSQDERVFMGLLAGAVWKTNHGYKLEEEERDGK